LHDSALEAADVVACNSLAAGRAVAWVFLTGTRGAKSACTLFFYNAFSDVMLNAEASACGERVAAQTAPMDAAADSITCKANRKRAVEESE
jgi:hypothetical protein